MALRLNGQTTGYTELNAPDNGDSVILTMPGNDGTSGQYLQTDGSGTLSWQTVSIPAGGKILQVVSDTESAASSIGPLGGNDESSDLLVCNITPTYSNSKIMIIVNGNGGSGYDQIFMRIQKDGTTIAGANGDAASNRPRAAAHGFTHTTSSHQQMNMSACYVETLSGASTSTSIKYAMRFVNGDTGTQTLYFNRAANDSDTGTRSRTASSMIVMEIAP